MAECEWEGGAEVSEDRFESLMFPDSFPHDVHKASGSFCPSVGH